MKLVIGYVKIISIVQITPHSPLAIAHQALQGNCAEKEVFTVDVDGINYEIRSPLPVGPDDADDQVWRNNKLLFVIDPHLDTCDEPCWKLTADYSDRGIYMHLVSRIGEEIERHYV